MYIIELIGFRSHTMGVHSKICEALNTNIHLKSCLDSTIDVLPADLSAYNTKNEDRRILRISWSGENDCMIEQIINTIKLIKFNEKIGSIVLIKQKIETVIELNPKKITAASVT